MTLEIEPIVNAGSHGVVINGDRWTVRTRDDALSANVEDAVAVTGNAPDILIRRG
jgi:methionyl aminopeptidase